MRLEISKLENSGESGKADNPAATDGADIGGGKFDRFTKSGENPLEAPGLYRLRTGEDGKPNIVFDRSETAHENAWAADETPETGRLPAAADDNNPEINGEGKEKGGLWGAVSTDRVDAEVKRLRGKVSQLEQRLLRASKGGDEDERKRLEAQLSQANAELKGKDNDAYRKANATYAYGK